MFLDFATDEPDIEKLQNSFSFDRRLKTEMLCYKLGFIRG